MNGPARLLIYCAITMASAIPAFAQSSLQPTPQPAVTAETQTWYLNGDPVPFAGNLYYPAGSQIHFNPNEMVRTGFYQGVPLYTRTTIEPNSMVFVPLPGGLMRPYELRRTGELAGTAGSTVPSFPVVRTSETTLENTAAANNTAGFLQSAAPPFLVGALPATDTSSVPVPVGTTGVGAVPRETAVSAEPRPVATAGRAAAAPAARAPRVVPVTRRPNAANAVFVDFQNARWFSSGRSMVFDAARFTRVGDLHGFDVYEDRATGDGTIYIPVTAGTTDLLAQYSRRKQ